jgi:L-seryl-tRNA(Ser) seleniumtransferase
VAISAGKQLRGPQTAGILAGRADLIRSVAMQHQDVGANPTWMTTGSLPETTPELGRPGHGIGRGPVSP